MQTIPKTKKDFMWVKWGIKDMETEVANAIEKKKEIYRQIKLIPEKQRTFENTIYALELSGYGLDSVINPINMLRETSPEKIIRDTAHKILDDTQKVLIDIVYDEDIYNAIKYYKDKNSKREKLVDDEKLFLKDTLRSYKKMGFELSKNKREIYKKNLKELSELENKFSKNINDYKDLIIVTEEELKNLPDTYKSNLNKNKDGDYIVSLDYPEIGPFMQLCQNEQKRKELSIKNYRKGGEENVKLLKKILDIRNKNAKMLGYVSHAHYVTEDNMAKTPANVWKLIQNINKKSKKVALEELEELRLLKSKETGNKNANLEFFDIAYYSHKLQKQKFKVDSEEIRKYFSFNKVKEGVFKTYSKLFSISFEKMKGMPTIHSDIEMFEVKDKKKKIIGYISLDLYPRDGKFGHAAMFDLVCGRCASFHSDKYIAPYACMVANFPKPLRGKSSFLSHGEVETFFHEFGHMMHGVLTKARYKSQSGTNVSRDFVEVPSQMFENWAWDKKVIESMSEYQDKPHQKMPKKIIDDLINSKKFMTGYFAMRQSILGILDMSLHWGGKFQNPDKLYIKMIKENTGIILPKDAIFTAGFGHLMGYDAGYYSYMWSLVYAHDIFSKFKKDGIFNSKTGELFKKIILEKGGSEDEMKQIINFLGRKPNNKAFLEEIGLK